MTSIVRCALCGTLALITSVALGQTTENVLYSFGAAPDVAYGGPVLVSDRAGNFYGIATGGGTQNGGGVFELSPNSDGTWTETVLYSFCPFNFDCPTGATPQGLAIDSKGNLFGSTELGGIAEAAGVVFELSPPSSPGGQWTYSVLYNFCSMADCADGAHPHGPPALDASGNLYGTGEEGGSFFQGVVWELSPNGSGGWVEKVLYSFCALENCADGCLPETGVVLDKNGNLYGTTFDGGTGRHNHLDNTGGTLYELSPRSGGWTEAVLVNFPYVNATPYSGPATIDPFGNVYTTFTAFANSYPSINGVVIKTRRSLPAEVFNFNGTDGSTPLNGVIVDAKRKMVYGTVANGQIGSCGGVFRITASGQESLLYDFCRYPGDASSPGALVEDEAGNLYGSSAFGGAYGYGAVFEITP